VIAREPRLALVLHTHMPYVEGFGTWPFGEEWLWESIACCYLPLLEVLDAFPDRVTLSLTPVLCDQLEAPGALGRCLAFLREVRPASHASDREALPDLASVIDWSAARYAVAAEALERRSLLGDLGRHATWTSAATHAVLPLLATDAGARLQLETGVASHRARFGGWSGGLWLPECAHAPWLDPLLEEVGVHVTCVDLTDVPGVGTAAPLCTEAGPLLAPIDRPLVELVWHADGYPSQGAYLDTHRRTPMRHFAWAVDGEPYSPERALEQARADAEAFAAAVAQREGLVVCALDTELLGDWWREGVDWLRFVLEACERRGISVEPLEQAVAAVPAVDSPADLPETSWGQPRDLQTWSAPAAGGLAWRQRDAELRALAGSPGARGLRELLALQSSDWAFLISRETAGPYPQERFDGHLAAFDAALRGEAGGAAVRNLAPHLVVSSS
jgi:1,4-alpha-glucan branching enzyme